MTMSECERSIGPRFAMLLLQLLLVGTATWWLLRGEGGGGEAAALPAMLLAGCLWVYVLRTCFTATVLLRRPVPWSEAIGVSVWVALIYATYALAGGGETASAYTWAGLALYGIGSALNTGSEWMRHRWKRRSENRGRLYTGGLFRYSIHINYFGDLVLFTGLCLIAGAWWTGWVPLAMAGMFIGIHIPRMDRYLEAKYGEAFAAYAARTKKLIPWVY